MYNFREVLERIYEKSGNLLAAGVLPVPAEFHVEGLTNGLHEIQRIIEEALEN